MCIVAIAWQLFEQMPLLLLSNRDEFFDRPTKGAHQWPNQPIYAGRDQKSGGTWLGIHQQSDGRQNGRWACVLNFRDGVAASPEQCSRGELVTQFLLSDESPMAYARQLDLTAYAGFNLLIGDTQQAVIVNNRGYPPTALHNGLHVFSNGQPNDEWFKCERLRGRMRQEVLPLVADNIETRHWQTHAFAVLSDTTPASAEQLPDTGVPKSLEQLLSAICIDAPDLPTYGTRTQSILTMCTTLSSQNVLCSLISQDYP